jgi:uncharacterized protein (DUF1800 family)
MSASSSWFLAYRRFGLGARLGGGIPAGDPKAALLEELAGPDPARIDDPALKSTPEILGEVYADRQRRKHERDMKALGELASTAMPEPNVAALLFSTFSPSEMASSFGAPAMIVGGTMAPSASAASEPRPAQRAFRAEAMARVSRAVSAPIGFVERLVAFWSNHFCVSIAKSDIGRACAGAFEREAIRPHVLGRFADMLLAVEQHPAMLNFLDNQQSIGPNSIAGHNRRAGLNENLARETLELHTMGVGSGYTQDDVTQLAFILTGWTIAGSEGKLGEPGSFVFNPNAHEPLAARLRGRLYVQEGVDQGEAALADLAREEATAAHIARKFARHFVADSPDPELVLRLAKAFRDTEGDLGALTRALVNDSAAWEAPPTKIRNPWEMMIAAHRAFDFVPPDLGLTLNALNLLGMPLWQPAGPNGFPDEVAAWMSPEGMKTRVEVAARFAHLVKTAPRPISVLQDVLGSAASDATREAVTRAETPEQAYALLILSPEFQRR